jgi:hypothetical protein
VSASALPAWLLELLSVDPERLQGGTERFRFARFPEGAWGLLALLAVLAAVAWIVWNYRRERSLAPPWRFALASLRSLVVAGTAAVIFYPVLEVDRARELRASTLVLLDVSQSMGIKDGYASASARRDALAAALGLEPAKVAGLSRLELAELAVARDGSRFLADLARRNNVKVWGFAGVPLEPLLAGAPGPASTPAGGGETARHELARLAPRGATTDIAGALRAAVEEEADGKVAGIVLLSDGRVTAGEDLKAAAAFLAERRIPVHAVGAGDPSPVRNLRVTALLASERVFLGDPVAVDVRIQGRGFEGEKVRVEILDLLEPEGAAPGLPSRAGELEVTFAPGSSEAAASFRFEPGAPGRHRLTARVERHADEAFPEDNERSVLVEVLREASRVLLIAGGPSYEYRFLKNLLRRDARIHLAAWLQSADPDFPQEGNVSLKKLPSTAAELREYDVILLLDPDPAGLPAGFPERLEEFVGQARGGLLYSAGRVHSSAFLRSPDASVLRNALPVTLADADLRDEIGSGAAHEREWPLEPAAAALDHPATRLSADAARNRERWAEVAGVFWSFPARKEKPGASLLFIHPDPALAKDGTPRPLAAAQAYAGGRAVWVGMDSTWRWRATAEEVYDAFWIQTLRYLTESRLLGSRRVLVETDRETYDLGEPIRISVYLEDENRRPAAAEEIAATVTGPDGAAAELRLGKDPLLPGWFRGVHVPRALGLHKVRAGGTGEKAVAVEPPALEFQDPRLDEEALRELAALTGGSYAPLAEIAAVPERIPDGRRTIITADDPIPLWDNWLTMTVLAGLLAVEWILRKTNRLP